MRWKASRGGRAWSLAGGQVRPSSSCARYRSSTTRAGRRPPSGRSATWPSGAPARRSQLSVSSPSRSGRPDRYTTAAPAIHRRAARPTWPSPPRGRRGVPKPSSTNNVSMAAPPASAWTTSARPSARAREARNDSPPDRVHVSRSWPIHASTTRSPTRTGRRRAAWCRSAPGRTGRRTSRPAAAWRRQRPAPAGRSPLPARPRPRPAQLGLLGRESGGRRLAGLDLRGGSQRRGCRPGVREAGVGQPGAPPPVGGVEDAHERQARSHVGQSGR